MTSFECDDLFISTEGVTARGDAVGRKIILVRTSEKPRLAERALFNSNSLMQGCSWIAPGYLMVAAFQRLLFLCGLFILKDGHSQKSTILLAIIVIIVIIVIIKTNDGFQNITKSFTLLYVMCIRTTRGSISSTDCDSTPSLWLKLIGIMLPLQTTLWGARIGRMRTVWSSFPSIEEKSGTIACSADYQETVV